MPDRISFYRSFLFLLFAGLLTPCSEIAGNTPQAKATSVPAWLGSKPTSGKQIVTPSSGQDPTEVTITADDKLPCPGQPVTFTAAVTNGGWKPVYQWQVNGVNSGTDSPVFVVDGVKTKLTSTDVVRCIVTNTDNGMSATSNTISGIVILDTPITEVFMYELHGQTLKQVSVCQGTPIQFLAGYGSDISVRLDPSFHYDEYYQLNGVDLPLMPLGTDLSPYVKNGDVLTVRLAYTSKCFTGSVVSNKTTIYVMPSTTPSVSIAANSSINCSGSRAKFTALALNAGKSPAYQWLLNGAKAGTNDSTFTSSSLKTGDRLQCQVTSSNSCAAGAATSNTLSVDLLPVVSNTVSISSSLSGKYVLPGQHITFTASVPDSTNLSYQWQLNGKDAGSNTKTYSSSTLVLGDVVTCKVTKQGSCVVPQVATSNAIMVLILTPLVVPNTFTPNGDGINDAWDLRALLAYPGSTVQVFNRYGALVYQSVGYTSGWDGALNGKQLPVGTYFYIIDLKSGKQPLAGSVTIIR